MRDLSGGPRVLLKRLRELMAEPLEPQERLDRIVRQIAANMVAEVCSVYVLRADGILGGGTRKVIEQFQCDNDLSVTGELNARTLRELTAQSGVVIP